MGPKLAKIQKRQNNGKFAHHEALCDSGNRYFEVFRGIMFLFNYLSGTLHRHDTEVVVADPGGPITSRFLG